MIVFPFSFIQPGSVTANLLLEYNTFDTSSYNGSGTTIYDISGNSRNGAITGSPTWTSNYFTFVDDHITTPNLSAAIPISNKVHSVEVWVYPTSNGVLVQYNGTTTPGVTYHFSAIEIVSGNLEVGLWTNSGLLSTGNIGAVSFNQWHQLVLTYDGSVARGYIDGTFEGSVTASFRPPMIDSLLFYMNFGASTITNQGDGTNFDGRFGIMRVYNIALSDAQVLENYNNNIFQFITPTQLLTNSDFSSGTTGWAASGGFGSYSYNLSNRIAVLNGVLYFTYISRTVSQSVNVSAQISSVNSFTGVINIQRIANTANVNDTYTFTLLFKNSANATVISKTTGNSIAPQNFTDIQLTLNRSEIPATFNTITTVEVQVTGLDAGFWNGNHGPMLNYIKLDVL